MSSLSAVVAVLWGLFVIAAICGATAHFRLLARLRNYHHEEWEAVLGTRRMDFLFANEKVLFYAFGRRWESLNDKRVSALVRSVRRCTVLTWLLLLVGVILAGVSLTLYD